MKFPFKMALISLASMLLVVGVTAGSGFAYSIRQSNGDSTGPLQLAGNDLPLTSPRQQGDAGVGNHHFAGRARGVVQVVADALEMAVQDVVAQLKEGNTLAQIIESNGGSAEQVTDTLVDRLRERLQGKVDRGDITQEQMDQRLDRAREHVTKLLNGERPKGRAHHFRGMRQVVQVVADSLEMTVEDVVAQLKEGNTLAQVIEAHDGDIDAIIDTILTPIRDRLQEKVNNGDITQEQMDQRMARARERVTKMLNGEFPAHRGHGKGDARAADRQFRGRAPGDARGFGLENSPSPARFRSNFPASRVLNADGGRGNERIAARMGNPAAGLQNAVASGRITREQLDLRLNRLQERQFSGLDQQRARRGVSRSFINQ